MFVYRVKLNQNRNPHLHNLRAQQGSVPSQSNAELDIYMYMLFNNLPPLLSSPLPSPFPPPPIIPNHLKTKYQPPTPTLHPPLYRRCKTDRAPSYTIREKSPFFGLEIRTCACRIPIHSALL